jgi:hypothetical protein
MLFAKARKKEMPTPNIGPLSSLPSASNQIPNNYAMAIRLLDETALVEPRRVLRFWA